MASLNKNTKPPLIYLGLSLIYIRDNAKVCLFSGDEWSNPVCKDVLVTRDGLKNLESLNLSDNDINHIGGLEKLKSLVSLAINKNHIKRLQGLDCCLNLGELFLRNNLIESLEGISKLKKLRFLDLSKNNLRNLEGIEMLFNLRQFSAHKNSLPNDPARPKLAFGQKWVKYAQLKKSPKIIDELKLRLNNETDEKIKKNSRTDHRNSGQYP